MGLHGRLHLEVGARANGRRRHERFGQWRLGSLGRPVKRVRIVFDHVLLSALGAEHAAAVAEIEHRLDAARDIAGEERDGPRWRDRSQKPVSEPLRRDLAAHVFIEPGDARPRQQLFRIAKRERALLGREFRAGEICLPLDCRHPAAGERARFLAGVVSSKHDQCVGETRDAEANTALGVRLLALGGKRISGHVDAIVEEAHGRSRQGGEPGLVERCILREGLAHEPGEIDRAQQAGAIRRQRLLPARVRRADSLAVGQVVRRVDAVDEDDARLGVIEGRAHDALPEIAGSHGAIDAPAEDERPVGVPLHGLHEWVGDEYREVEIAQPPRVGLGGDELLDVRMIAAQGRHHGAAPLTGRHDGAAHGVPDVHEADGTRGIRADARDRRPARPQRREIMPDAAPLLHRQRRLAHVLEDR